jgi:raffinose/stachyose/melibiose transport system substrate-binding protein
MRKSKWVPIVWTVCMVLLVVTGCSKASTSTTESKAPATEATPAASSEATTAPAKDPVTLTFLLASTENVIPYQKIFQAYETKTGNKVELQSLPGGDYDNMIKTRFATGDFPDLFLMQPGTKQYVKLRADETLYDWANEKDVLGRLLDNIKEFQTLDSKIYGVPFGATGAMGIYYNKEVFDKVGVKPPTNYADLLNIAQKIKTAGITPFYEGVKDGWPAQIFYLTGWVTNVDPAIGKDGVEKLNKNELHLSQIPALKDLFVKQLELKKKGFFQENPLAGTYDEMQTNFGTGKAAMMVMLDGVLPQLIQKFGEDFVNTKLGFFPFPSEKDDGIAMLTPPNQIMVPKKGKHMEAAIDLVKFMTSPEMVNIYYQEQPGNPIYKEATSKLYPTQQTVKGYIDAGKATVNIQNRLTASFVDLAKTLQDMIITGDVDKAISQFEKNYEKDGKNKLIPGF